MVKLPMAIDWDLVRNEQKLYLCATIRSSDSLALSPRRSSKMVQTKMERKPDVLARGAQFFSVLAVGTVCDIGEGADTEE